MAIRSVFLSICLIGSIPNSFCRVIDAVAQDIQAVTDDTVSLDKFARYSETFQQLFSQTLIAIMQEDEQAAALFVQHHMPLFTHKNFLEYQRSLTKKTSTYARAMQELSPASRKLLEQLHKYVEQIKLPARGSWVKPVVIGAVVIAGTWSMYRALEMRKERKTLSQRWSMVKPNVLARGTVQNIEKDLMTKAGIVKRTVMRKNRDQKILARMILDESATKLDPRSPFYLERDMYDCMHAVAKTVADSNKFKQATVGDINPSNNDLFPGDWQRLASTVYRAGDIVIKTHRNGTVSKKSLVQQNVRRALAAFRINHIAPTAHEQRVKKHGLPRNEWQVCAATMRLVPLAGTITPQQAKEKGIKPSPIDDAHYVVLQEAVATDHVDGRKKEYGCKPMKLGDARAAQVATAAYYAGTDDLHNNNVIPAPGEDPDAPVSLLDIEEYAKGGYGVRPTTSGAVYALSSKAFFCQNNFLTDYFGKLEGLADDEVAEIKEKRRLEYAKMRMKYMSQIQEYARKRLWIDQVKNGPYHETLKEEVGIKRAFYSGRDVLQDDPAVSDDQKSAYAALCAQREKYYKRFGGLLNDKQKVVYKKFCEWNNFVTNEYPIDEQILDAFAYDPARGY